jgi:hypothetical protein
MKKGSIMTISLKAKVEEGGMLTISHLPLAPGQEVMLTIVSSDPVTSPVDRYPLRDTPYRYDEPFAPAIDPDEWEANR